MYYWEFSKSLKKSGVCESTRSYRQLIEKTDGGKVYINGTETEFKSLEEAKQYIKEVHLSEQLEAQVSKDTYEEMSDVKIANIIKEHHEIKVTDTLIESYKQFASSNMFSIDPVVQKIRGLNKLDSIVEGKIHYVLNDQSVVTINEATQDILNTLLQNQTEIIEYMREGKENFLHVLEQIGE